MATLINCDRPEYGTITVDMNLLRQQIGWLQQLYLVRGDVADDAREGILNLLGGIQDLTDPPKERDEMTNEERGQRAETALAAYIGNDPADLSSTIVDLVTDLLHLAHQNDIEPDYVTTTAQLHYTAEVEEEAGVA